LRVFSRRELPDRAWFRARLSDALALRAPLRSSETTAFRCFYGEGDGVPGVSIDVYDRYAVLVTYADSLDAVVPELVAALGELLPLDGIVKRRREPGERLMVLSGREPPNLFHVREHGIRLAVDLRSGQKTGLFLDHRENRAYVRALAADKRVLNLFAYTGA